MQKVTIEQLISLCKNSLPAEKDQSLVSSIVGGAYESYGRFVKCADGKNRYGRVFPMNPEVLFELMSNVEGKSVLELGAASGENALLLGLAGAKEVFVNDIVKSEVKTFEKTIARLSSKEVREKFHAVAGDCLEIFESPEYEGRFDLIYARNFYHFFFGEKKDRLNALFKKLLKPKGLLVISTNSVNVLPESQRKANCFVYESLTPLVRLKGGNHKIAEPTYAPYELQANEEIDPL